MSDDRTEDQHGQDPIDGARDEAADRQELTQRSMNDLANKIAEQLTPFTQLIESQRQLGRVVEGLAESPAGRVAADLAENQQKLAKSLADSPAFRTLREFTASVRRWQVSQAAALEQARAFVQKAADSVGPWLKGAAAAIGRTVEEAYRSSAPPNWVLNDNTPAFSYLDAMRVALEEGIPLAWAADPETVIALMAVPREDFARREVLRTVLRERSYAILDYAEARLEELTRSGSISPELRAMIDVAQQSVRALRLGLPAPAQSAAANLVDSLIRRFFAPLEKDGRLSYSKKREHVENLQKRAAIPSLTFFAVLRETVTLLAVAKSLTEWWPGRDQALPDGFSRHTTAHAIAEPDQVNPTNALIAVMLAVSLICQEADSAWISLRAFVWKDDDAQRQALDHFALQQARRALIHPRGADDTRTPPT